MGATLFWKIENGLGGVEHQGGKRWERLIDEG